MTHQYDITRRYVAREDVELLEFHSADSTPFLIRYTRHHFRSPQQVMCFIASQLLLKSRELAQAEFEGNEAVTPLEVEQRADEIYNVLAGQM